MASGSSHNLFYELTPGLWPTLKVRVNSWKDMRRGPWSISFSIIWWMPADENKINCHVCGHHPPNNRKKFIGYKIFLLMRTQCFTFQSFGSNFLDFFFQAKPLKIMLAGLEWRRDPENTKRFGKEISGRHGRFNPWTLFFSFIFYLHEIIW